MVSRALGFSSMMATTAIVELKAGMIAPLGLVAQCSHYIEVVEPSITTEVQEHDHMYNLEESISTEVALNLLP